MSLVEFGQPAKAPLEPGACQPLIWVLNRLRTLERREIDRLAAKGRVLTGATRLNMRYDLVAEAIRRLELAEEGERKRLREVWEKLT
jgi:hypothetical protein